MKDFNFLTKINAVYNSAKMSEEEEGVNAFYILEVFINDNDDMLIKFNKCLVNLGEDPSVEEGEKIFKNIIGPVELEFIKYNIKNNEKLIKELILSKFLDYCNESLNFMFVF